MKVTRYWHAERKVFYWGVSNLIRHLISHSTDLPYEAGTDWDSDASISQENENAILPTNAVIEESEDSNDNEMSNRKDVSDNESFSNGIRSPSTLNITRKPLKKKPVQPLEYETDGEENKAESESQKVPSKERRSNSRQKTLRKKKS